MKHVVSNSVTLAVLLISACTHAVAQEPPSELEGAARVQQFLEREGEWLGPALWPGFRPDTLAMVYVVPGVGKLFAHRGHEQPEGFRPYPGRPGWGWAGPEPVSFPRGPIAFQTFTTEAATLGLAIHEAFHEYQEQEAREGIAFGRRENAMTVVTYPVFDAETQADLALEGALLSRALTAEGAARRLWAARFLAVRRARRAGLADQFVAFERATELNEGLAQYALVKGLAHTADRPGFRWTREARSEVDHELDRLPALLETGGRSVRRTFYTTGAALGLLLDELAEGWKHRLMGEDVTLDSLLAEAVVDVPVATASEIRARSDGGFRAAADEAVRALAAERAALRDSLLTRPGTKVDLRPGSAGFDWCGFDPQNTLATETGEILHMRWLRLCVSGEQVAEINGGVVQRDDEAGYVLTLPDSARVVTVAGSWRVDEDWPIGPVDGLEVVAAAVELRLPRAELLRDGGRYVIAVRDTAPTWARRVPPIDSLVTMAGQAPLLWPGFRPDTIPTVYMVRGGGAVFVHPADSLPAAFTPLGGTDGGWTTSSPFGPLAGIRFTLTSVLPDASAASDAGLAVHETFHGHQTAVRSDDRRFGRGESPAGIRVYPTLDPINVSLLDREAKLLGQAVAAGSDVAETERLAREFLAVRMARRMQLPDSLQTYERMAELNEGLAEYVRIRALERWAAEAPQPYAEQAREEHQALMDRLDALHRLTDPQPRRIFYATGTGIGKVLDRLQPAWAAHLVRDDTYLDEQLARVVGGPADIEVPLRADPSIRAYVEAVSERRAAMADSLLAIEGLVVRIEWEAAAGFGICGLDPLNAAPVGDGRVLHRFVRLCHEGDLVAAIGSPSVESLPGRSITVPLGVPPNEAAVTVNGRPLVEWLEAPTEAESLTVAVGGVRVDAPVTRVEYRDGRLTAVLAPR